VTEQLANLPPRPGCYLFYNRRGELLYIGKAISLRNRVRSYFHKDRDRAPKIRRLVKQIARIELREVPTELHALTLECRLIKEHQPRFNALLKSDRRLPRLRVTLEEKFPRVFLDWSEPQPGSRYFGPFTRHDSAEHLLDVMYRVFKLRSCELTFTGKEGLRPCLYYHLDQCLGPCSRKHCSEKEYGEAVRSAMDFLEGRQEALIHRLENEMNEAAEALQFERAARLRDLRGAVLRWMERQNFLAGWEESSTGLYHLFLVHGAQLAGYCTVTKQERAEDSPAWRLAVLKTLRETYATPQTTPTGTLLGASAIEELNIMESWLQKKQAVKTFVAPPQDSDDFDALERMMVQIEEWLHPQRNGVPKDLAPPANLNAETDSEAELSDLTLETLIAEAANPE
jgi:excinuclease ABC subunit C